MFFYQSQVLSFAQICNYNIHILSALRIALFTCLYSILTAVYIIVHIYRNHIHKYLQVVFGEDEHGYAHHVMGIVHDAAAYLPDLLEHMADNYPSLTVKNGVLGRNSDIETTTMKQYRDQVI
jgi:hypothetical protein